MLDSLWGDEFKVESNESEILSKIKSTRNSVKVATSNKKLSLSEKLESIKTNVYKILGNRVNDVEVIRDKQTFRNYIDTAINNGLISIDTETNNSLDPLTCKLMGLCLYTPGLKAVYIPVNHISMYDNTKLSNQLTEQDIHEELSRLTNTKIIFHNAKFDYQVIKCTCNVDLDIYFDTMICAKILDENESASLKSQYIIHINPEQEKYSIEHLFEKLSYEIIDPNLFVLYAATDALITYELYKYQVEQLNKSENSKLCKILFDIEIPFIKVIANMELRGIKIDNEYSQRLSVKYHKKLDEIQLEIDKELENLRPIIDKWRLTREANEKIEKSGKLQKSKSEQLEDKVNLDSPTQLSILLYDVLKVGVIDKKTPRGTGSEILEKIDIPLCKLLVERKAILKLSKDFIDALPEKINGIDGRIHCEFNQYGAATGRLSSSNPNLQQIPSHDKSVRMMFTASDGYKLVGSDYSAQEPRLTAFMSHDKNMLQAYLDKKDLYAVIASLSFNKPYEECLEFYPEGTKLVIDNKEIICGYKTNQNKAGKERRSQAKAVLLGLLYGRGANSISEQIGKSKEEAQEIIDKFFKAFPSVQNWIENTHRSAKKLGYVEDWYGRRRRLPDILLPEYVVESLNNDSTMFNPFLDCDNLLNRDVINKIKFYETKIKDIKWVRQFEELKEQAKKDNISLRSNSILISQAERQSVNSIIQGGAATLTKLAMINIDNDEELNRLGFKMLLTIHDEVLGECPEENAERVADRLSEVMINTPKSFINVPMVCDAYIVKSWYEDEYIATLKSEYKKLEEKNLTHDEIISKLIENHSEVLDKFIINIFN